MVKRANFGEQVPVSRADVYRINVAQLALALHKLPSEIRALPWRDYVELVEVRHANEELAAQQAGRWEQME